MEFLLIGGIAVIVVLVVIIFIGGEESDGGSAGCGTVGGDLTMAQMKANFEPNAKGGILEGKSQYLLDLAKKIKFLNRYLLLFLHKKVDGENPKMQYSIITLRH